MAEVKWTKKIISVPTEVDHVNLTLTVDEAQTLCDVLRRVGGEPHGRRQHIINIERALGKAGVQHSQYPEGIKDFSEYSISFIR